jgi:hypothetical protein
MKKVIAVVVMSMLVAGCGATKQLMPGGDNITHIHNTNSMALGVSAAAAVGALALSIFRIDTSTKSYLTKIKEKVEQNYGSIILMASSAAVCAGGKYVYDNYIKGETASANTNGDRSKSSN